MEDTKALLWLAVEDYAGLWEAVWELRSIHPDAADGFLLDRARVILSELIEKNLIQLFFYQESSEALWSVASDEVGELLAKAENWVEPKSDEDILIRFSATSAGETRVLTGRAIDIES
ncbi:hypothetical protein G7067_09645 [Leucobacter insecticola]|uniref:Uncharacterized protein n=1 Tax=Leucobacter insecticola TaxID=2714934 RepID=A0A6G8FK01_9MICO|nr:hypothetical protein [Leucobacter insecticola]QIM16609.1 hypothetical protein G7067_09645 [Leucobacter insecticola]